MSKQKEYSVSLISAGELITCIMDHMLENGGREFEYKKVFSIGVSKNPDWNYAGEGIYKEFQEICVTKFKGNTLFGLEHNEIKLVIDREIIPYCTTDDWKNEEITMNKIFNYHFKKRVLTASINWKNLFIKWQIKKSSIIELTQKLKEIYPVGYIIKDREFRAWKA
ncbi:unnamed protein product [Rhizophagus irregularis]|nr:unnamed protein product [Rhizophagus irregularis]